MSTAIAQRKPSSRKGIRKYVRHTYLENGATKYEITAEGLAEIERRSRAGHDIVSIAKALGINASTFRELRKRDPRCQEAIDIGRAALGDWVSDTLIKKAKKGETAALIFLAKGRLHWRETGPVDPNQTATPTVNININAPMSDDDFRKLVDVTPRKEE